MLRSRSREARAMAAQKDVRQEILQLTQIIETDQAALRLRTISKTDKAQLGQALEQRKARVAHLQEQLAALPGSK